MQSDVMLPWLVDRRWFAGKGRPVREATVASSEWLAHEPRTRVEFVTVFYDSVDEAAGERPTETYQVPVVYRPERIDSLSHALIGQATIAGEQLWAYDAVYDKQAVALWPAGMNSRRAVGDLTFHQDIGQGHSADDLPTADLPVGPGQSSVPDSYVVSAEQSNTSVVFDDAVILKIFRRLSPGQNPDLELHQALAETGNGHVARLLGWADGSLPNADPSGNGRARVGTLAVASEFLPSTTSGWDLALTSVRDLVAGPAGLGAGEAGGDFAAEARRLGQATAEVHADLAKVLGTDEFDLRARSALVAGMGERLAAACAVAPQLESLAPTIRSLYEQLGRWPGPLHRQRIHGDLHLGQVLRALGGWRILDFEGEPARPMEQRREPDSPLRDVAGMLRSFDYAAGHLLPPDPDAVAIARAREWAAHNQRAFLAGYAEKASGALPDDGLPLRVFTLDKACYEVLYEARNRPGWIALPLRAVHAMISGEDGQL